MALCEIDLVFNRIILVSFLCASLHLQVYCQNKTAYTVAANQIEFMNAVPCKLSFVLSFVVYEA